MNQEHKISIQNQFNQRADNYEEYTAWLNDKTLFARCIEPLRFLDKSIKCLDLGGGTGWFANEENKKSGREWTVLDISDDMGKKVPNHINFVQGDFHHTPFPDNYFGFIIARSTLQYSPSISTSLKELKRILHYEGQFVIAQIFNDNYSKQKDVFKDLTYLRNPLKKQIWSSDEFRKILIDNKVKILKQYKINRNCKYNFNEWLSRSGTIPKLKQRKIIKYLDGISVDTKEAINLKIDKDYISYDVSWGVFICAKNIYTPPKTPLVASLIVEKFEKGEKYILLQKRQSFYENPKYHDTWELPQGKIEIGETIRETAVRELHEETGLKLQGFKEKEVRLTKNDIKLYGTTPFYLTHIGGDLNFISLTFIVKAKGTLTPQILNTKPEWVNISHLKSIIQNEKVYPLNFAALKKYLQINEE